MTDLAKSLGKAVQRTSRTKRPADTEERVVESPPAAKRGRGGHLQVSNPHTKRLTLDITPEQDRYLSVFGINHGVKKNPTLRALIHLLEENQGLRDDVLSHLETQKHRNTESS